MCLDQGIAPSRSIRAVLGSVQESLQGGAVMAETFVCVCVCVCVKSR